MKNLEKLSRKKLQNIKCQKYLSIPITPALSFVAISSSLQLASQEIDWKQISASLPLLTSPVQVSLSCCFHTWCWIWCIYLLGASRNFLKAFTENFPGKITSLNCGHDLRINLTPFHKVLVVDFIKKTTLLSHLTMTRKESSEEVSTSAL